MTIGDAYINVHVHVLHTMSLRTKLHVDYMYVCTHKHTHTYTHTLYHQCSCLVEVGGANTLSHDISLCSTQGHCQLLGVHDVLQLLSDISDLSHCYDVDEMLRAPARGVTEEAKGLKS